MIFQGDNFYFKINESALNSFQFYRQLGKKDPEAGGVLLGRYICDTDNVVVDRVTEPMENDTQKRFFFKKCRDDHQALIDKAWTQSNGTCNYLGEWHTHPEPHPVPSSHDLKEWEKVLKYTVTDTDRLFFVIIGTKSFGVWLGIRKNLNFIKLEFLE